jgi:hypothetical protein
MAVSDTGAWSLSTEGEEEDDSIQRQYAPANLASIVSLTN